MAEAATTASLSPARRRLVSLMQEVNFGWIENLSVRDGDPLFDPPPTVVRQFKFGADDIQRAAVQAPDFALKRRVRELFEQLDRIGSGVILRLEVRDGLPFTMSVKEIAA